MNIAGVLPLRVEYTLPMTWQAARLILAVLFYAAGPRDFWVRVVIAEYTVSYVESRLKLACHISTKIKDGFAV